MENKTIYPLVSIIMPLYNAQKYVAEAIESVINQTNTNWELIIVNDGSTDNSLEVATKFESNKIRVYTKKNAGAAAARNYGYQLSKGTFIKFFDADDLINPKMIEEQVNLATKNPDCIISGKWGRFYKDDLATFKLSPEDCWLDMKPVDWMCSSWRRAQNMTQPGIFLIPKKTIDQIGLWNENLSLVDDMEFFTKIILGSKSVIFCERAILQYRSGMGSYALSGYKSTKSVQSYFLSLELSTSYLLNYSKSDLARLCCANLWQGFVYEYYLKHNDLVKQAENYIKKSGKSDLKFTSGRTTKYLSYIFGWKNSKKIYGFFIRTKY